MTLKSRANSARGRTGDTSDLRVAIPTATMALIEQLQTRLACDRPAVISRAVVEMAAQINRSGDEAAKMDALLNRVNDAINQIDAIAEFCADAAAARKRPRV